VLTDLISAAVRSLSFIALFQAAGMAIFIAIFGRQLGPALTSLREVAFGSAIAAVVLVAVHYSLEAARMAGELAGVLDFSLQQMVFDSPTAAAFGARAAGLALIAVSIRREGTRWMSVALAGVVAVIIGFLFVGHTASDPMRGRLAILLSLHLAVVAFWFGALAPLHIVSRSEAANVTAAVVERFSRLATVWVPMILLAGVGMTLVLVDRWSVFAEAYGWLLLLKLAGFAALMVLAGLNKWRYGPALARTPGVIVAFRRTVAIEYGLICAVLIVTAFMTTFFSPEH
jgi:putative copper resistance protein D